MEKEDYTKYLNETKALNSSLIGFYQNKPNELASDLKTNAENKTAGFIKEVHTLWLNCGGTKGGRPNNSVKYLIEKMGKSLVKSLYSKLAGNTPANQQDIESILNGILSNWRIEDTNNNLNEFLFDIDDIPKLTRKIADNIFCNDAKTVLIKEVSPKPVEFAQKLYIESDVFFVISRSTTVIDFSVDSINDFKNVMSEVLLSNQQNGNKDQKHIWVLDAGNRDIADSDSIIEFINFSKFRNILSACALFAFNQDSKENSIFDLFEHKQDKMPSAKKHFNLWNSLIHHGMVVVIILPNRELFIKKMEREDGKSAEINGFSNIKGDNILPSTIPEAWITDENIKQLKKLGILEEAYEGSDLKNFTIAISSKKDINNKRMIHEYYPMAMNPEGNSFINKDNEFKSPGKAYDEALALMYFAAMHRLEEKHEYVRAIWYLRKLGFEAMRMDDFINHPLLEKE